MTSFSCKYLLYRTLFTEPVRINNIKNIMVFQNLITWNAILMETY